MLLVLGSLEWRAGWVLCCPVQPQTWSGPVSACLEWVPLSDSVPPAAAVGELSVRALDGFLSLRQGRLSLFLSLSCGGSLPVRTWRPQGLLPFPGRLKALFLKAERSSQGSMPPHAVAAPLLQACTPVRFCLISLPALTLLFLISTCVGPRRRVNKWVPASLVSAMPRNLCSCARSYSAFSNWLKVFAEFLPTSVT